MSTPSVQQLQRAIQITEQIHKLEMEVKALLGSGWDNGNARSKAIVLKAKRQVETVEIPTEVVDNGTPKSCRKRRKMSPEARQRIVDAQKKRWAAVKAAKK